MHWAKTPIHIIDFEGTPTSGIIEYGIVTVQYSEIIATHTELCHPTGEIHFSESQQHGLYSSDLNSTKPFSKHYPLFSSIRKSGPLCAHNAAYEDKLITNIWPYSSQSPDFVDTTQNSILWGPWIDTCQLYRALYPSLPNHKLMHLIHRFGLEKELQSLGKEYCPKNRQKHHCALYDAIASALLLLHIGKLQELQNAPLIWFILNSASSLKKKNSLNQQSLNL